MRTIVKLAAAGIALANLFCGCAFLNDYQEAGELSLNGLEAPVTVHRDERGMAYVRASGMNDALVGQGFTAAQDRLFQMELNRRFAAGRISEFAGEKALDLDIRMRTLGLYRAAQKHAQILDPSTREFFQRYADGVNAYVKTRKDTYPLEFGLAGIEPEPWSVVDSLAVLYLMAWNTSANIQTEIVMQTLVEAVGPQRARELLPLNINPDAEGGTVANRAGAAPAPALLGMARAARFPEPPALEVGSNNWVAGPEMSAQGRPIVANDPHLDARILPGPWYPVGLLTPGFRAVGVNIAGIPGITVGRTSHLAFGVTNAYGDMQDLYVENVDPENPANYLEGDASIPFEIVEETIRFKDEKAPGGYAVKKIRVRKTRRGPVVSGIFKHLKTDNVLSLRFAPFETMHPVVGFDRFLTATSVSEAIEALRLINMISLNMVVADTAGNIAWWVTGTLPERSSGGTFPHPVTGGEDNWRGWVPFEKKPHAVNPEKGWIGTCNHTTITPETDYYHSSYFSPSFRYRRLKELMEREETVDVEDHWQFQRDTKNLLAVRVAPLMAEALSESEETSAMGEILDRWDFHDDADQAAPTIFQAVFRKFAFHVFEDELGEQAAAVYLDNWYVWQERLLEMILENDSAWFDDVRTKEVREERDDLFVRAAMDASAELEERLGRNPEKWLWGKVHQLELVSPIRREGFGKGLLGGGSHPFPGSGETLCRGWYDVDDPFAVTHSASLRMVADLADGEKVLAVMPGGVCERIFHPHAKDQVEDFLSGRIACWWFSDKAVIEHSRSSLVLAP
jgi:penicillin amidase